MKNLKYYSLIVLFPLFFIACNEDEDPEPDPDTSASQDYSLADNLFEDVSDVSDQAEQNNEGYLEGGKTGSAYLGNCVTISFDTVITSSTNTITIDFGPAGCVGQDQRTRKGKIFVEYDGRYRDSGTVILTTFEDYFVDDHQLLGSKTVTNLGKNNLDQSHFSVEVDGRVIKADNGGEILYKSSRTRTWVEGEDTQGLLLGWLDDVYEITGTASGTSTTGKDFNVTITKPLEVKLNCRWVTQGTVELVPDGLNTRIFDFGDGSCDPNASVSVGGIKINFIMP